MPSKPCAVNRTSSMLLQTARLQSEHMSDAWTPMPSTAPRRFFAEV